MRRTYSESLEPIVAISVVAGVHFDAKAGTGEEGMLELLKCNKGLVQDETRPQSLRSRAGQWQRREH